MENGCPVNVARLKPAGPGYRLWRFTIRYLSPVFIVPMFLNAIGVFG